MNQKMIEGLEKLASRKSAWTQSPEQKTDASFRRWWKELLRRKPGFSGRVERLAAARKARKVTQ